MWLQVVAVKDFISSKHNMAMSFNRSTYDIIKEHAKVNVTLTFVIVPVFP